MKLMKVRNNVKNASDLIRINREFHSNGTHESDSQKRKHDGQIIEQSVQCQLIEVKIWIMPLIQFE
jgi:hypothetical protein